MAEVWVRPLAADAGLPAVVRVGDVLVVELPENPTSGYVWNVAALPGQLAELPPDAAEPPAAAASADVRPGAATDRVLRFAVQQPGIGELRLRHGRSWEPTGGEELAVEVRVEPGSEI